MTGPVAVILVVTDPVMTGRVVIARRVIGAEAAAVMVVVTAGGRASFRGEPGRTGSHWLRHLSQQYRMTELYRCTTSTQR